MSVSRSSHLIFGKCSLKAEAEMLKLCRGQTHFLKRLTHCAA